MDTLVEDLLHDLECVTCTEYMIPPITMCINGHNICHSCKTTLTRCPTCRGNLIATRSRGAETLSNRITHPCKYRVSGCTAQCLVNFKEEHEKECPFSPVKCPGAIFESFCVWEGPLHDIKEHLEDSHSDYLRFEKDCTLLQVESITEEGHGFLCFIFILDEIFFSYSKQINSFLHWNVMFVGSKEQAKNFKYRATIKSEGNEQSMSVCLTCRSYFEFLEKSLSFSDERSAIFPRTFYKKYIIDQNGREWITVENEIMRSSFEKQV